MFNPVPGGVIAKNVASGRVANLARDDHPNRLGMQTDHALWPGREWGSKTTRPDTALTACMTHCATDPHLASLLPDHARNAHGHLRDQNRLVGPQRGANTWVADASAAPAVPGTGTNTGAGAATTGTSAMGNTKAVLAWLGKHHCTACHGDLPVADAQAIAAWLARGAPR